MARGARAQRAPLLVILPALLLLAPIIATAVAAQTPPSAPAGSVIFRVVQNGAPLGAATAVVTAETGGWLLEGTSLLRGKYDLEVRRFEVHYDAAWGARFASMELKTPAQTLLVHTAIGAAGARTDFVQKDEVQITSQPVSADAVIVPDMVFTAFVALAMRLQAAEPGADLHAFILPIAEIPVHLDSARDEDVLTTAGRVTARRWHLTFMTPSRTVAELWVQNGGTAGGLLRIDMPADGITVKRSDVVQ